jgi:hypothetical protein
MKHVLLGIFLVSLVSSGASAQYSPSADEYSDLSSNSMISQVVDFAQDPIDAIGCALVNECAEVIIENGSEIVSVCERLAHAEYFVCEAKCFGGLTLLQRTQENCGCEARHNENLELCQYIPDVADAIHEGYLNDELTVRTQKRKKRENRYR